jgi:peptidoglycan hydrolase-like protein with peptidoglycan-binding domain
MAYSLTWIPDALLQAGLKVAKCDGWEQRGVGEIGRTLGVICHHTGGSRRGNMAALQTLIDGRSDLRGPLAHLGLGRDGTYYMIAARRANHAGQGAWNGLSNGNGNFVGIEAQNAGSPDDPWPEVQLDAYRRGVAALLRHLGLPASACAGHGEYALPRGRKVDPSFPMQPFRDAVAQILAGTSPPPALIPAREPPTQAGAGRPTLRRDHDDPLVRTLRERLGLPSADRFDGVTEARLREFQRARGLVPDGIVGPKTWRALDAGSLRVNQPERTVVIRG